ncbi:MAG: adenylate kinase [Ruminococcaceae bacterium]|nr:adenylate kinase [Oscillospiraceae bacterium]
MKVVFFGPPGAGKGTQAAKLSECFGIPAISTGHIIRQAMVAGTSVGKIAEDYIKSGALLPDDIVFLLVAERIQNDDCQKGYILDGFPRTLVQAQLMDEKRILVDFVLDIELSDDSIVKRMSGRRVCNACGAAFHIEFNPPTVDGVCNECGESLTIRADDAPEVVLKRLAVYHEQTEPLKAYYEKQNKLIAIDGEGTVEEIFRQIKEVASKAGDLI